MVNYIFDYFNLEWSNYVDTDKNLLRDGDPVKIVANPSKLKKELPWETKIKFNQMLDNSIK